MLQWAILSDVISPVSRFEDLAIPFSAVAFDLANSERVVMSGSGDLVTAVRASCAVPGVFAPVRETTGRKLVDGGGVSPMPVGVVGAMGAEVVIGVDVLACGASFRKNSRTGVGIMIQSVLSLIRTNARTNTLTPTSLSCRKLHTSGPIRSVNGLNSSGLANKPQKKRWERSRDCLITRNKKRPPVRTASSKTKQLCKVVNAKI